MRIPLTCWPTIKESRGRRISTTWDALASKLSTPRETNDKLALPGFAIATFKEDTRALANVERVFALGFDFDALTVSIAELANAFHSATIVHSTYSSTAAQPRARAFSLLSRGVTADEYSRLWRYCADKMEEAGQSADRAAKDASRLWFPSAVPVGSKDFIFRRIEAEPLNVDRLLASIPPEEVVQVEPVAVDTTEFGDVKKRAWAYLQQVPAAVSGEHGHDATFIAACKLVRGFGLQVGDAFELLAMWNRNNKPPWTATDLLRKVMEASKRGTKPAMGSLLDRRAS